MRDLAAGLVALNRSDALWLRAQQQDKRAGADHLLETAGAARARRLRVHEPAGGEEARTRRPLQAAAVTYRIAPGLRAGQKVLTQRGAMPRETAARQPLYGDIDGFSLHDALRVEAHDRMQLERLCRYITRQALSDERGLLNSAVQVELKLKTP
jgi:hypothetical protein